MKIPSDKYEIHKPKILKLFEEKDNMICSSIAIKIGVTIPTAMTYLMKMYIEGLLDYFTVGNKETKIWNLK